MRINFFKTNWFCNIKNGYHFVSARFPRKLQTPRPDPSFVPFSEKVEKWGQKNNINYLDLSVPFSRNSKEKRLFFDKDIHFNKEGHKVKADIIENDFNNIFTQNVP